MIGLMVGYLSGSINFAILISRWAKGIDIRSVGNKNPGTANVGREVGRGWAALVFLGDLAKGVVPILLARILAFPEESFYDYIALFLIGMAAITGHCWPLFHGFRGGGGLATSIGVFMFFVPLEFFCVLLISYLLVQSLFSKKKYAFGQLVPMFFVPLAPILVALSSLFLDLKLFNMIQVGGYPWYVTAGVAVLAIYIVIINFRIVRGRLQ